MRTLKNVLLYCGDFLRVMLIGIPVNLVMTKRGRLALIVFGAFAVVFAGLHFWNSKTVFFSAPNQVEKTIESAGLDNEVVFTKDKIIDINTKNRISAQDFVKDLKPGEQVLAGYYWEEFRKPGDRNAEFGNLVKVYYGRQENGSIVFQESFPEQLHEENFYAVEQNKEGIVFSKVIHDIAILIWIFGGMFWVFVSGAIILEL